MQTHATVTTMTVHGEHVGEEVPRDDSPEAAAAAVDDVSSVANFRSPVRRQSNESQTVNTREESSAVTKHADHALANETIKILAHLLTNARRAREEANSMRGIMRRESAVSRCSQQNNDIEEMMGTTCGILEMMFRHSIADCAEMYDSMGSSVILLLLQIIDHCLPKENGSECFDDASGGSGLRGARDCVDRATEILCHFARIPEARMSMANLPGVINGVLQVVESRFSEESHTNALWVIANLACERENILLIASQPGLVDALVTASKPEAAAEPGCIYGASAASNERRHSRKQAVRALMNLTVSGKVQASLCSNDHGLAEVMLNIMRWGDPSPQTRGLAAATMVNMANAKGSAAYMTGLCDGSFLLELVRAMRDELSNSLTVSYCLETFRLLAADGGTDEMCSCPELLDTLTDVAAGGHLGNNDAVLAASTLKRLAAHTSEVTVGAESKSSIQRDFLDSLVKVVMSVETSFIDVLGRIGDALAGCSQHPLNRTAMIRHEGLFDALCKLSTVEGTARCATASLVVLRSLTQVVQDRSLLGTNSCVNTVANLLCRTDLDDAAQSEALELTSKLASTAACRRLMSRNERLMVALVTKATQSCSLSAENEASMEDVRRTNVRDTIVLLMSVKDDRGDDIQDISTGLGISI